VYESLARMTLLGAVREEGSAELLGPPPRGRGGAGPATKLDGADMRSCLSLSLLSERRIDFMVALQRRASKQETQRAEASGQVEQEGKIMSCQKDPREGDRGCRPVLTDKVRTTQSPGKRKDAARRGQGVQRVT
jgi:hypothetical protein